MKLWMLASSGIDSNSYLIYDDEKTALRRRRSLG